MAGAKYVTCRDVTGAIAPEIKYARLVSYQDRPLERADLIEPTGFLWYLHPS